jgi:hypothetical protein
MLGHASLRADPGAGSEGGERGHRQRLIRDPNRGVVASLDPPTAVGIAHPSCLLPWLRL